MGGKVMPHKYTFAQMKKNPPKFAKIQEIWEYVLKNYDFKGRNYVSQGDFPGLARYYKNAEAKYVVPEKPKKATKTPAKKASKKKTVTKTPAKKASKPTKATKTLTELPSDIQELVIDLVHELLLDSKKSKTPVIQVVEHPPEVIDVDQEVIDNMKERLRESQLPLDFPQVTTASLMNARKKIGNLNGSLKRHHNYYESLLTKYEAAKFGSDHHKALGKMLVEAIERFKSLSKKVEEAVKAYEALVQEDLSSIRL
jgi:hypothetical protein